MGSTKYSEKDELISSTLEEKLWSRTFSDLVCIDPLIGSVLADRFEILALIGTGACSRVYKARQLSSGRIIALKLLHTHLVSDQESVARFKREAESGASLNHTNICTIYEYGHVKTGQPFIAMEYLSGESLSALLRSRGLLPLREALPIFIACLNGLEAAHEKGIIHRDIKPANIFVSGVGPDRSVKLLDFGLAKMLNESKPNLTQSGVALGTVHYMSPEQVLSAPIDVRSDIYSLACVMYETLTGTRPFPGRTTYELLDQHVNQAPLKFSQSLNAGLEVEYAVLKALEKDPDRRYQNVDQLRSILQRLLQEEKRKESLAKALPKVRELAILGLIVALLTMCLCSSGLGSDNGISSFQQAPAGRP